MLLKLLERLTALIYAFFFKLIYPKNAKFNMLKFSLNGSLVLINGCFKAGPNLRARKGCIININGGTLEIKEDVFINYNCSLNCRDKIEIGSGTIIGEGVKFYDHDHSLTEDSLISRNDFITAPIKVGKNVWIGANVIILKGVEIGDNTIISAGAVITKSVPENVTVIQKKSNFIVQR